MWLIITKMKIKLKNASHRYDINRARPRYGHKYTKHKICLSVMMTICNKQQLSNIWSWIHEKVKQHWNWVEKKKSVSHKKSVCSWWYKSRFFRVYLIKSIKNCWKPLNQYNSKIFVRKGDFFTVTQYFRLWTKFSLKTMKKEKTLYWDKKKNYFSETGVFKSLFKI